MLRSWLGDWIGTFLGESADALRIFRGSQMIFFQLTGAPSSGHKGAVWSSKISLDTSRAITGSADFTA